MTDLTQSKILEELITVNTQLTELIRLMRGQFVVSSTVASIAIADRHFADEADAILEEMKAELDKINGHAQ